MRLYRGLAALGIVWLALRLAGAAPPVPWHLTWLLDTIAGAMVVFNASAVIYFLMEIAAIIFVFPFEMQDTRKEELAVENARRVRDRYKRRLELALRDLERRRARA